MRKYLTRSIGWAGDRLGEIVSGERDAPKAVRSALAPAHNWLCRAWDRLIGE